METKQLIVCAQTMAIQEVPVDLIDSNPFQPRQDNSPEALEELAADISRNGLIHPPVARAVNGRYQLACGHRRVAACRALGWEAVPVDVRDLSDQDMALMAWSENESRRDLNPLERAEAIRRMMETFGWTQEQAGQHLGLARSTIANILRLLDLRPEVQEALRAGRISERQALALAPLSELQWEQVDSGNWVRRRVQELLDGKRGMSSDELRDLMRSAKEEASRSLSHVLFDRNECDGCEYRKNTRCYNLECFRHKTQEAQEQKAAVFARETGVAIISDSERPWHTYLSSSVVGVALKKRCPHLRVAPGWIMAEPHYCCTQQECECQKEVFDRYQEQRRQELQEVDAKRQVVTERLMELLEPCSPLLLEALLYVLACPGSPLEYPQEDLRQQVAIRIACELAPPGYSIKPEMEMIVQKIVFSIGESENC